MHYVSNIEVIYPIFFVGVFYAESSATRYFVLIFVLQGVEFVESGKRYVQTLLFSHPVFEVRLSLLARHLTNK